MKRFAAVIVLVLAATQAHAKNWRSDCYPGKVYDAGFGASIPEFIADKDAKSDPRRPKSKTDVFADIIVGPDGLVKCVNVHDTPFPDNAKEAEKIAWTYKFTPALKDYKPVTVWMRVKITVVRYE